MQIKQSAPVRITFIFYLSFISILCQGQDLQSLNQIELCEAEDNKLILENGWHLTIEPDSQWIFHVLQFKRYNDIKLVDTVDITSYGFNFKALELNHKETLVLIIETIYEYISYYPVYLIQQDEIKRIGHLNIRLDCKNCDSLNYPLENIIVKGNEDKIEFTFKDDIILLDNKDYPKFRKENIRFLYEFENEKLMFEKSTGANSK